MNINILEELHDNFDGELNDSVTRQSVKEYIMKMLELPEFMIQCDEKNNPPEVIDNNECHVDIHLMIGRR